MRDDVLSLYRKVRCPVGMKTPELISVSQNQTCAIPKEEDFKTPSQLAYRTLFFFHIYSPFLGKEAQQWMLDHTKIFLFVVRDPLDRMISAYNFQRRNYLVKKEKDPSFVGKPAERQFYLECFSNVTDFWMETLRSNDTSTRACRQLGLKAIRGEDRDTGNHFAFNYKYYARNSIERSPEHAIAVVRTNHMWEDTIHLEKLLGGTGDFDTAGSQKNNDRKGQGYFSYLSRENTVTMCCLMFEELEVYQSLVLRAFNLNDEQKRDTLSKIYDHCSIVKKVNLLEDPFSWKQFRHSPVCSDLDL